MKERKLKVLLKIQSVIIVILLSAIIIEIVAALFDTELLCETSPDGNYVLRIVERGKPIFISDHLLDVTLYENSDVYDVYHYSASFYVLKRGFSHYEIEWLDDAVQVMIPGAEPQYFILPFKTLEDSISLK